MKKKEVVEAESLESNSQLVCQMAASIASGMTSDDQRSESWIAERAHRIAIQIVIKETDRKNYL